MSDARRSYQPTKPMVTQTDDSKSKGKPKKVAKLIPKRRPNERLAILHACRFIPGPGNSKDDAMDIC